MSHLNEEKNVIPKLLPLLEEKAKRLQQQYAETKVLLKAQLMPEQAERLLATYTVESGQNLSMHHRRLVPICGQNTWKKKQKFYLIYKCNNAQLVKMDSAIY
jgi:hypothetical protein